MTLKRDCQAAFDKATLHLTTFSLLANLNALEDATSAGDTSAKNHVAAVENVMTLVTAQDIKVPEWIQQEVTMNTSVTSAAGKPSAASGEASVSYSSFAVIRLSCSQRPTRMLFSFQCRIRVSL